MNPHPFIHPTALVEEDVKIGDHSKIWDYVHIRKGAKIGHHTMVGGKSLIAYNVIIGNYVKINSNVYIPAFVTIEDGCMISAGVIFTNDVYPRSMNKELTGLETSDPTEDTLPTHVARGVTIGANATIGPGVKLGEYSMIGMGAVVTKDVPPFALVVGNPAKKIGFVCVCGPRLPNQEQCTCHRCGRRYHLQNDQIKLT